MVASILYRPWWASRAHRLGVLALLVLTFVSTDCGAAWRLRVLLPDSGSGHPLDAHARRAEVLTSLLSEASLVEAGVRWSPVVPASAEVFAKRAALDAQGAASLDRLSRWWTVEGERTADRNAAWVALRMDPGVEMVLMQSEAEVSALIPDDPLFLNQGIMLGQIDGTRAWDVVRGEEGEVVIAIVDGGTDWRHPDLEANIWSNPGEIADNGIDDDGNGFVDDIRGWNFSNSSPDPTGAPSLPFNAAHGTHVAGSACAVTGNAIGVTGTSFNARLMPINASDPERDRFIAYGYDGILYAALNGADIINCSWRSARNGGTRSAPFNEFENAVVETATALGALVVAAAGNDARDDIVTTPGFYESVLSVTGMRLSERVLVSSATAGPWIDLAAPGFAIVSTEPRGVVGIGGGPYNARTGTSHAAPLISGVAALVKTLHPEFTPEQLRQRLRATAIDLRPTDPLRGAFAGAGLVQAGESVAPTLSEEVHITDFHLLDEDGDGLAEGSEVLTAAFRVHSTIDYEGAVQISLSSDDPLVFFLQDTVRLPRVRSGDSLEVRSGIEMIFGTTPPGHIARFEATLLPDGGRALQQSFYREIMPQHAEVGGAGVAMSAVASGKLGYAVAGSEVRPTGVGLRAGEDPVSYLVLGGLLLGTGPDAVSDAVQPVRPDDAFEDFRPIQSEGLERVDEDDDSIQHWRLRYSDRASLRRLGAGVTQDVWAFADVARGGLVISAWEVEAQLDSIVGLRPGVLLDWSADPGSDTGDRLHFDATARLQWVEPADSTSSRGFAGVVALENDEAVVSSWLWALDGGPDREGPFLYDVADLTAKPEDAALWSLMTGALSRGGTSPEGNVVGVLSCPPRSIARGETSRMALAFLVGQSLDELREKADTARILWEALREGDAAEIPQRSGFFAGLPTPFPPGSSFRLELARSERVRVDAYDLRGRRVRSLVDDWLPTGYRDFVWDGRDGSGRALANGVYFLRLVARSGSDGARVLLIR